MNFETVFKKMQELDESTPDKEERLTVYKILFLELMTGDFDKEGAISAMENVINRPKSFKISQIV